MTFSDLEKWDTRGQVFQTDLLNSEAYRLTYDHIWQDNTCSMSVVLGGQSPPAQTGRVPVLLSFGVH